MAVSLELHNTGDPGAGAEVRALLEHAFGDRPGDWRVSIVGSRKNDSWGMKILGPNGFERSYALMGSAGEHQPVVTVFVTKCVAVRGCFPVALPAFQQLTGSRILIISRYDVRMSLDAIRCGLG